MCQSLILILIPTRSSAGLGHLPGVFVPSITQSVSPEVPAVPLLLPGVTNLGSRDQRQQHKAFFGAGGGQWIPLCVLSQEKVPVGTQRRKRCVPSTQKCASSEKAANCPPAHPWSPPSLKSFPADRKNMSHKQGCGGPERTQRIYHLINSWEWPLGRQNSEQFDD